MQDLRKYKAVQRFYVEPWMIQRIQSINYDLIELMHFQLLRNSGLDTHFRASRQDTHNLKSNRKGLGNILDTPFSMLTMTISDAADWECLLTKDTLSRKMEEVQNQLPRLEFVDRQLIDAGNRRFLDLVTSLINMNVLAAPMLGITAELAKVLVSVSPYQLGKAMERLSGIPLFGFRFANPRFWLEFTSNHLSEETIAHQLMLTAAPLGKVPYPKVWHEDFRLSKNLVESYSDAMMAYGCRASTTASLFRLAPNYTRGRFTTIHNKPSACGNQPNSLSWFIDSPAKRLHSSVYSWLYRSALAGNANVPEALIAANDLYHSIFGRGAVITPDRACLLTRSMSADNRLTIVPCKNCDTEYIASNSDTKIEMHSSFQCPGCRLQLVGRSGKNSKSGFSR